MARRRRKRQRGGTIPVAPIVAGAKMIAKRTLEKKETDSSSSWTRC